MKKKKKINIYGVLSVIFLLTGLSLFTYHYVSQYNQTKQLNKIKADFEKMLVDPPEKDDTEEDLNLAADMWGMLTIDSVGIELPIAIADNFDGLYTSLVAYSTSPEPPNPGNFAIAGHNGSCAVCTFRDLHDTQEGDTVEIRTKENTFIYEVYAVRENLMNTETWVLDPVPDETTLTLITCQYSSWTNPLRLVVQARLIETIPR